MGVPLKGDHQKALQGRGRQGCRREAVRAGPQSPCGSARRRGRTAARSVDFTWWRGVAPLVIAVLARGGRNGPLGHARVRGSVGVNALEGQSPGEHRPRCLRESGAPWTRTRGGRKASKQTKSPERGDPVREVQGIEEAVAGPCARACGAARDASESERRLMAETVSELRWESRPPR